MNIKFRKMKAAAFIMCAVMVGGSFTYVNNHGYNNAMAKTISDLEDEKAENNAAIAELQQEINDLEDGIANEKYRKSLIQEKIDYQTANLDIIRANINELSDKVDASNQKIESLKKDMKKKQKDINIGKEQFKQRLCAMYVNGNDSLASALVGATDFYDALCKMELISQISQHDNELINSLKTQLQQYQEAKTQLDIENKELSEQLAQQEASKAEFDEALAELQAQYQESDAFIDEQEQRMKNAQGNIDQYEKYNAELSAKEEEINQIAAQYSVSSSSSSSDDSYDDDDDYSNDSNSNDSNSDDSDDDYSYSGGGSATGTGSLCWPCAAYGISSPYGSRWGSWHGGIDISNGATMGAAVYAADSGTVVAVCNECTHNWGKDGSCGCGGGYGNYIMIDHGNGMVTMYAHLSYASVSMGQAVSRGETIGAAGSTGWSTGAHLHFEVIVNGSKVDPQNYV